MAEFNPGSFQGNIEPNPLQKYFRQPKVYVTLPSKGMYYAEGSIDMPENGELPVLAMTAKDELAMKTPDALLNGQATVDVIQSCVPNIKNAWKLPSIDLDALLIAIRIATYGETMEITTKVPNIGDEKAFSIDLRQILNQIVTKDYENHIQVNNMNVYIEPLTYQEFTEASMKTFEEQRIFALVNDDSLTEGEKLARFSKSFAVLTDLTVKTLTKSIKKISIGDTEVSNQKHIQEFIDNADKEFYSYITEHLDKQKEKFAIEPFKATSTEEEIARGAPESFTVPITFDQSNFFA